MNAGCAGKTDYVPTLYNKTVVFYFYFSFIAVVLFALLIDY